MPAIEGSSGDAQVSSGPIINGPGNDKSTLQPSIEQPELSEGPKPFHIPPEILSKIFEYIESENPEKPSPAIGLVACNLALVCQSFYNFFATETVFKRADNSRGYLLLQNSIKMNIWEPESVNKWFGGIDPTSYYILPPEVWNHKQLLELVLKQLKVTCAPSREDLRPYANDEILAKQLISKFPCRDLFAYLGDESRGSRPLALEAVRELPSAIKYCSNALLNDRDFIKQALEANGECLQFLGDYRAETELVNLASENYTAALDSAKGEALAYIDRIYNHKFETWKMSLQKPGSRYCYNCRLYYGP